MALLKSLRNLQILGGLLASVGLLDSLYLWYTKVSKTVLICGVGECDVVNASPYASLLGIPVAAIGAVGYAALMGLAIWAVAVNDNAPPWLTDLRFYLACGGLFFAAYLTAIEVFVLHAI